VDERLKNERDGSPRPENAKTIGALIADIMDGLSPLPVHPRNVAAGDERGGETTSGARVGQLNIGNVKYHAKILARGEVL